MPFVPGKRVTVGMLENGVLKVIVSESEPPAMVPLPDSITAILI